MLYDPAPLNNPNDPGHDMSQYVGLLDEGTFKYRRTLVQIDDTGTTAEQWTTTAALAGGAPEDQDPGGSFAVAAAALYVGSSGAGSGAGAMS